MGESMSFNGIILIIIGFGLLWYLLDELYENLDSFVQKKKK